MPDFDGYTPAFPRRGKKRYGSYSDNEPTYDGRFTEEEESTFGNAADDQDNWRWSTWNSSPANSRGPIPYPDWLVTDAGAVDIELGILKTGKEADVFLVRRENTDTDRRCLMAAKRFRVSEHRMFHRETGYLEGRKVRNSREMRAMANSTDYGRKVVAEQWARTEFGALSGLYQLGLPVPYPVQVSGQEILMEFVGQEEGIAAPRLADARLTADELTGIWDELVDALVLLAREGFTHGDLSPYNLLVHDGQIVIIDLPQIVNVLTNPQGPEYLERDVRNICAFFTSAGMVGPYVDPDDLHGLLRQEVGL
ncbi:serine protein kinase RIO [Micromonospora ureilytica]|uniref:non-specific serine/threonine protein kinase n=1 Tax=Micromonospora ureilytica TaxID=709868 RepID=A0ABS0JRR8_9ACTN|nr:RIO1 family regulatory kinase/ATPase [Micromonospora ureilytica]MBG6069654.1 RIO kinase 1 [Micromonospora ureilytica]